MSEVAPAPLRTDNLLDAVEATLRAVDPAGFRVVPILRADAGADVSAIALRPESAPAALRALEADPAVASVEQQGQRFLVRFADERIAATGAGLEAGCFTGMETDDLRAGTRAIVDFCDPNATKALHVGHLRNIALGQAVTMALRAAGAHVERQSHIGDAGRSMGEAMAGWERYAAPKGPGDVGAKSDHFVGELYARYVREEAPVGAVADEDAPVARDLHEIDDHAQRLLNALIAEQPDAVALWQRVRDWAVTGQNVTLARLGVHFERILYDSDRTQTSREVAQLGIERGVFVREPRGTIAYLTGDDNYPVMPLTRADGFPTHHLRVVAMWRDMMLQEGDAELIHLSGDEWQAHVKYTEQLLAQLEPGRRVLPSRHVVHGMVSSEADGELSSSKGTAQLVDELLDELAARPEVRALAREGEPLLGADDLVAIAVLGFCLDKPVHKGLAMPSVEHFLDTDHNVGWRIARAWAKAWEAGNDGAPDPVADDAVYRHVVLQAQLHRRNLAVALEDLDLLKYVRYVGHLSGWYLDAAHDARVGRVMRALLASGLGTLGLVRAGAEAARAEALRRADAASAGIR
ncbi:MAG TPA: arginine--tRNA ligase [Conexibacter sp.]|nr:arginine--tRNA ligase [Conexibacter sp.]